VPGFKGVSLSAYNEISVAVLNSVGIIKISSATNTTKTESVLYVGEEEPT